MLTDPAVLIAAPFIVFAAYTVFGITGFGSALISIPLLAHFLPLDTIVPLMVLVDFSAACSSGLRDRHVVDRGEVRSVLPMIGVGVVAGVLMLKQLPGEWLLVALGIFVTAYGLHGLARGRPLRAAPGWLAHPAGFLGGLLGAVFGIGGPIYVMYFGSRIHDTARLRATLSVVFSLSTGMRIAMFVVSGLLLDWHLWLAALGLLPMMFAGTALGRRIHLHLSRQQVLRTMGVLLVASGASLLVRGLAL